MALIITRIQVGDYEQWRPMFEQDVPRAREKATTQRVLRSADDPNEVVIYLEFASLDDAREASDRLLASACSTASRTKRGRSCWKRPNSPLACD